MVYFGDWSGKEGIAQDFQIDLKELKAIKVLIAWYTYEDYSGAAFVLYEQGGKLYEVHGCHCSCYGLEGQWEPEETTVESLSHRLKHGKIVPDYYSDGPAAEKALIRLVKRRETSSKK